MMEEKETMRNDTAMSAAFLCAQCRILRPRLNSITSITPAVCGCPQWDSLSYFRVLGERNNALGNTYQTRSPWRGSVAGLHVELEIMTERCEHRGIDDGRQEITFPM